MSSPDESSLPPAPGSAPRETAGVTESVREMARGALRHLELRCSLFGLEASMAAGHVGRVVAAVAVVLIGGGLGYLTGWAALVVWAARRWAGGDLVPPMAVMAGVHVLAALGAGCWLAVRWRNPALFAATQAEFAEDQKWLRHPKP